MKTYKNLFCLILMCIGMSIALTGCGEDNQSESASVAESQTAEPAVETTTEETISEAADNIVNVMGNNSGNISNDGKASIQGEWIYYVGKDKDKIGIYRMKNDGTGIAMFREGDVSDINIIGEYIYFLEKGNLIKIKTNGAGEETLKEECELSKLCVKNDWIYYVTHVNNGMNNKVSTELNKIYKVATTGIGDLLVTDKRDTTTSVSEFYIENDKIYYTDGQGICRMNMDGSGVERILSEQCDTVNVSGEWVYFVIKGKIYKVSVNGGESAAVNEDLNVSEINVTDDAIYYVNAQGLGKITLNGSGATVLNADWGQNVNVAGDWIFGQKGIFFYKMKTDGSEYIKFGK